MMHWSGCSSVFRIRIYIDFVPLNPDLDWECVPRSGSSNITNYKTERKKATIFTNCNFSKINQEVE
jgi:hypothetical protein